MAVKTPRFDAWVRKRYPKRRVRTKPAERSVFAQRATSAEDRAAAKGAAIGASREEVASWLEAKAAR